MKVYCGPFALTFITKNRPEHCVNWVKAHRCDFRAVKSMWWHEMLDYLEYCKVPHVTHMNARPKITLARWLRTYKRQLNRPYLVLITGHFVVIKNDILFDTGHPHGVPIRKYSKRRARVVRSAEVLQEL